MLLLLSSLLSIRCTFLIRPFDDQFCKFSSPPVNTKIMSKPLALSCLRWCPGWLLLLLVLLLPTQQLLLQHMKHPLTATAVHICDKGLKC